MKIPSHLRQRFPVLLVAGLGGFFHVVYLGSAQSWQQTTAPSVPWQTVAASADFTKIFATGFGSWSDSVYFSRQPLPIYMSTDYGVTWTQTSSPTNAWTSLSVSADGTKLVAVATVAGVAADSHVYYFGDGLIYTSTNSGASWLQTTAPSNHWASVASSADGTKLAAVGDGIYLSSDSGATWNQASTPSNYWSLIVSSPDGTILVASSTNACYSSTDSGQSWRWLTNAPGTITALSADGTNLAAMADGIYTSTNSGVTWTLTTAPIDNSWASIASSADGGTLVAVSRSYGSGLVYTSTNSGATWVVNDSPWADWIAVAVAADGNRFVAIDGDLWNLWIWPYLGSWRLANAPNNSWSAVAASTDGNKLFATGVNSGIYASSDSGANWVQTSAPDIGWVSVASSDNGTKLVAAAKDGLIYTSVDSGLNWIRTTAPSNQWASVASSADGVTLVAAGFNGIYTSTNSGTIWTTTLNSVNWSSVASSADGTKQVAVARALHGGASAGVAIISTNLGASWWALHVPANNWTAIACSADGTRLIAAGDYGVYRSSDSGLTWLNTGLPSFNWSSVASSSDGTRLFAVTGYVIYSSSDSGTTWMIADTPGKEWNAIACSANASNVVAVSSDGPIYTLRSPTSPPPRPKSPPRLTIGRQGTDLSVSWVIPSSPFKLQQTSVLSPMSWTIVSTPPTLNFTNLHYQVTVSQTNQQSFFQLKQ